MPRKIHLRVHGRMPHETWCDRKVLVPGALETSSNPEDVTCRRCLDEHTRISIKIENTCGRRTQLKIAEGLDDTLERLLHDSTIALEQLAELTVQPDERIARGLLDGRHRLVALRKLLDLYRKRLP